MLRQQCSDRAGQQRAHAPGSAMRQVRHLDDRVAVPGEQLGQRRLVVPAGVAAVDPRPAADAVHEIRDGKGVGRREHELPALTEVPAGAVEETSGTGKMLDELPRPHDLERTAEVECLGVARDHVVPALACPRREVGVELDNDRFDCDGGHSRVHPVGTPDAGAGTDVEHRPAFDVAPHARKALGMTARLPVLRLERMPGRHRGERRRRIIATVATVALVLTVAACSGSDKADTSPSTSAPRSTTSAGPSTTVVPTTATTPVTSAGGTRVGTLTAIDGNGPALVDLPADARPTAIVHAQYQGNGAFIISGANAAGHDTTVLAQSVGPYDGSFPVWFGDSAQNPTTALRVDTTGAWHLDVTDAKFAPELSGAGVSGQGDAVLAYRGPETPAHVIYPGTSPFAISIYANGQVSRLAGAVGPYDRKIALPAGPAFISVTADGDWSMSLG